ncbi:MAG TPA: class I SAM-dependent methyltransferase [Candidatus Limnocylindrales bacterium]|nr:class I SAM-dependent methyltransferase [Candidatus Limnocylindrales bacterium]
MVIDLGTGDGAFVLATARAEPGTLAIGVDADASRMAEASRRAARTGRKGGLPNTLFVASAVEALPAELCGLAHEVRVHLPWGSLLRGAATPEPWFTTGLARLLRPGGSATLLLSATQGDAASGIGPLDPCVLERLSAAYATAGFDVIERRSAHAGDVTAARSSWGKRLGAGRGRAAWLLRLRRSGGWLEPR